MAAALAAIIAAVVVVIALRHPDTAPATGRPATPGPTLSGAPPTGLRLRDDGTSITVSWADPSAGTVPFIVAGGRAGQKLGALGTIDAGRTSYTVNGLSPHVDYCFTVLAVYGSDAYATSGQVCTTRSSPSPR